MFVLLLADCDVRHEDMLYLLEYAEHRVGNRTRKAAKVEDIMAPLMEEYMTLVTSRSSHIDNPTTTAPTEGGCSMAGASASSRCKRMREELDTIAGASCDAMDTTPSSEENGTAVVASGSASVSGATASLHAHSKGIMRWADVKHIAMKTLHSKYVPLMEVTPLSVYDTPASYNVSRPCFITSPATAGRGIRAPAGAPLRHEERAAGAAPAVQGGGRRRLGVLCQEEARGKRRCSGELRGAVLWI